MQHNNKETTALNYYRQQRTQTMKSLTTMRNGYPTVTPSRSLDDNILCVNSFMVEDREIDFSA